MKKILVILGPTSSGKTDLGVFLSKILDGEIISADSRQVYKGMNIGTGKDVDAQNSNFKFQISNFDNSIFEIKPRFKNGIPVWLLDIVNPDYRFNVGEYSQISRKVISDIEKRGKLPIIVGGTGLYIKSILEPLSDIHVAPDETLRKELNALSLNHLQDRLKKENPVKWYSLNNSDKNNPRRLIRYIELSVSKPVRALASEILYDKKIIGLMLDRSTLEKKIRYRVEKRLDDGLLKEIETLLKEGYTFDLPSFTACGYALWRDCFDKNTHNLKTVSSLHIGELKEKWVKDELHYAKRQMTFFKKMKDVEWIYATVKDLKTVVVAYLSKWYNSNNATY